MTTGEWDNYLTPGEASGYVEGDVAATWNAYVAHSDASLDAADAALDANDDALYAAAGHLGTDPGAVESAFQESIEAFDATNQAQWASLGFAGPPQFGTDGAVEAPEPSEQFDDPRF